MTIPAYALANVQEGIARSYDWVGLGNDAGLRRSSAAADGPDGAAYVAGLPMDAVTAMIRHRGINLAAHYRQFLVVNHRLSGRIAPDRRLTISRLWLVTALPILMAGGFYPLLAYTDVLVLQQFRRRTRLRSTTPQ